MPKSKLLDDFEKQTTNKLLKELLVAHNPSPKMPQDQKISILVAKLEEIFWGLLNETQKH